MNGRIVQREMSREKPAAHGQRGKRPLDQRGIDPALCCNSDRVDPAANCNSARPGCSQYKSVQVNISEYHQMKNSEALP